MASASGRQAFADDNPFNLQLNVALLNALPEPILDPLADPPGKFKNVIPGQYDPAKTYLVQAAWLNGLGCPTSAAVADYPATSPTTTYTDPACHPLVGGGDPNDGRNEGLLMVKTGPTNNNASAVAQLINVKGLVLTQLGYDIRKYGPPTEAGAQGSHCGAGAPRFNITTSDGFYFLGCQSPPADFRVLGDGWIRLRWGVTTPLVAYKYVAPTFVLLPVTGTVERIVIVFDEGTDTGPDFFGAAILDNIDVNQMFVGRGPVNAH
jgi:hypothetical protein